MPVLECCVYIYVICKFINVKDTHLVFNLMTFFDINIFCREIEIKTKKEEDKCKNVYCR